MPTYAPVPESFKRLSHRGEVLHLYRHILKQATAFFDQRASEWMVNSTRSGFRKQFQQQDPARLHKKLSEARKALRTIERANNIDKKAVERILRLAYGIEGKERQRRLQPFVQTARVRTHSALALSNAIAQSSPVSSWSTIPPTTSSSSSSASPPPLSQSELLPHLLPPSVHDAPKPLHFQYERSIPPIHSPALTPLLKAATTGRARRQSTLDPPDLPEPLFKPLHGKREANLRWRYFTRLVRRAQPPLPGSLVREMEFKARLGLPKRFAGQPTTVVPSSSSSSSSTTAVDPVNLQADQDLFPAEWAAWETQLLSDLRERRKQCEAQRDRRWEDGKFYPPSIGGKHAQPHVLTLRFYRRLWERLLDEAPLLQTQWTEVDDGEEEAVAGETKAKKSMSAKMEKKHEESKKDMDETKEEACEIEEHVVNRVVSKSRVPTFAIRHSRYSAAGKKTVHAVGLKALVSDFDRLGFDPSEVEKQPRGGKSPKKPTTSTQESHSADSPVKQ
ncbi:hypothetical protein BGZ73_006783 [Actinomortierella ambigua]|nr:hypothetical protein BGZ73_006783 [Actinomortierella ambigua]